MKKIVSYLGFAIKSNKIVYGQDNLEKYHKKMYLILVCHTAKEKMIDFAKAKAKDLGCKLAMTNDDLSILISRDNCKILGITNESLSSAVLTCTDDIDIL